MIGQVGDVLEAHVRPPLNSKASGDVEAAPEKGDATSVLGRMLRERILVDVRTAATAFSVSQRTFHVLRNRPDFPGNATVVFSDRCVRFRVEALYRFALSLAASPRRAARRVPRGQGRARTETAGSEQSFDSSNGEPASSRQPPGDTRE